MPISLIESRQKWVFYSVDTAAPFFVDVDAGSTTAMQEAVREKLQSQRVCSSSSSHLVDTIVLAGQRWTNWSTSLEYATGSTVAKRRTLN